MYKLAIFVCLLATATRAQEPVEAAPDEAAPMEAAPMEVAPAVAAKDQTLGLSLFAGGSALLVSTAVATTLIETLATSDSGETPAIDAGQRQVATFIAISTASVSAVILLVGGALLIETPTDNGNRAVTK